MSAPHRIKRGDTIRATCTWSSGGTPTNLTGYALEAEVRTSADRALAASLTVTLGNQGTNPGTFELYLADTSALERGMYLVDIRVTEPDGDSYATDTWTLIVEEAVTAR